MFTPRFAVVLAAALAAPTVCRAADVDPLVPADTESYVLVQVRQLLDAPVMKKHLVGPAREMLKERPDVTDVLADLGFDPFRDLHRLVIARPASSDADRGLLIARGKFDLDRFRKKGDEAARDHADVLKLHKVPLGAGASHVVYEVVVPNQDSSLFVALVDDTTLIASPGKDYVVDALKAGRLKGKPTLKNRAFQATVEKLDGRLTVALAVAGKAVGRHAGKSLPEAVCQALANVDAVGGGLAVGDELKVEVLVATKSDESARKVREAVDRWTKLGLVGLSLVGDDRKELALALEVLKTIKATNKGSVVAVSGRLTADVLQDFLQQKDQ